MRILLIAVFTMLVGNAQAANLFVKNQPKQQVVYVQPEPLRQIPIVGTVVYGGLNYAGALILSPLELITGPRR